MILCLQGITGWDLWSGVGGCCMMVRVSFVLLSLRTYGAVKTGLSSNSDTGTNRLPLFLDAGILASWRGQTLFA